MKRIVEFLRKVDKNNNREWFNAHKDEYKECQAVFHDFVRKLVAGIREFDESIGPLDLKDCTYRIYRDTRFSPDKTPYKIQMGCYVAPMGKKSGFSGYYFQIGAYDHGYPGGCMLGVGDYCCDPKVLRILREDIDIDRGEAFKRNLEAAPLFSLDTEQMLKKAPKGFDPNVEWIDYLKLKNYCLLYEPGLDYMLAPGLLERTLRDFATTKPFLDYINRAIAYSKNPD